MRYFLILRIASRSSVNFIGATSALESARLLRNLKLSYFKKTSK
jgi:hypothetical protein